MKLHMLAIVTVSSLAPLAQGADVPNPSACASIPSNLVSWWRGEGNAADLVGQNNGLLLGGATFGPGEIQQAFVFNGGTSGIKLPASSSLDVGTSDGFTVEAWINPQDLSIRGEIMEWNNGDPVAPVNWGISLEILSPGELGLGEGNLFADIRGIDQGLHWLMAPGGTITANTFQHVALTYDKASGVGRLFCKGAIVAQAPFGTFTPQSTYDCYIGRRPAGTSAHSFLGSIDEVSLYNRALSTNEIAAIYSAGSAGKCHALSASVMVTQVAVCWPSEANKNYQVDYRLESTTNQWMPLGPLIPGDGSQKCVTDPVQGQLRRFYRVHEVP